MSPPSIAPSVGASVGACVGAIVGAHVGDLVGAKVGTGVGTDDGYTTTDTPITLLLLSVAEALAIAVAKASSCAEVKSKVSAKPPSVMVALAVHSVYGLHVGAGLGVVAAALRGPNTRAMADAASMLTMVAVEALVTGVNVLLGGPGCSLCSHRQHRRRHRRLDAVPRLNSSTSSETRAELGGLSGDRSLWRPGTDGRVDG